MVNAMVTDEERREVARKMRDAAANYNNGNILNAFIGFCGIEFGGKNTLWKATFAKLADLIDPQERTCRNLHDAESYRWFECSECGCGLEVLNDEGISNIEDGMGHFIDRPRYCPNCGARITEVDDA